LGLSGISPGTYSLQSISHQTGLSVTATEANTFYNIGSSVTVPRDGIVKITISAHVSAGGASFQLVLTRGSANYYIGSVNGINNTSSEFVNALGNNSNSPLVFEFPVLLGDVLQLQASNETASYIDYVDDFLVILQ